MHECARVCITCCEYVHAGITYRESVCMYSMVCVCACVLHTVCVCVCVCVCVSHVVRLGMLWVCVRACVCDPVSE